MVAVEGEHTAAVLKSLRGIPEVQALHTTNGRWDIVVEVGVESLEGLRSGVATHPAHQGHFEFRDKSAAVDAQDLTPV